MKALLRILFTWSFNLSCVTPSTISSKPILHLSALTNHLLPQSEMKTERQHLSWLSLHPYLQHGFCPRCQHLIMAFALFDSTREIVGPFVMTLNWSLWVLSTVKLVLCNYLVLSNSTLITKRSYHVDRQQYCEVSINHHLPCSC